MLSRLVGVLLSPGVGQLNIVDRACWLLVAVSWSGLILAELGRFSGAGTIALAAALLGLGTFAVVTLRPESISIPRLKQCPVRQTTDQKIRLGFEAILVCGVLLAAGSLYARPGEMIFSTHDAGVRLNSAAHIASTGKIFVVDPDFTVAANIGSFRAPQGIYKIDTAQGLLVPQFSGVSEIWEALVFTTVNFPSRVFHGDQRPLIENPGQIPDVTAFFALASVGLIFITLRQSLGFMPAWTAMTGLAVSYPEIYYARIPMSEIIEQLFFVVALYALARYWHGGSTHHAVLAGFGVGLTVLTHLDAVMVYLAVVVWLSIVVARREWTVAHTAFAVTSGLLFVQSMWHDLVFETYYVFTNTLPIINVVVGSIGAVAVACAAIAGWIGFLVAIRAGRIDWIARSPRIRVGLALVVVVMAAAAYFGRPLLQPPSIDYAADGSVLFVHNEGLIWVTVGRYLSPITLLLSLAGIVFLLVRRPSKVIWTMLLVGGVYGLFLSWHSFVSPHQPFWIRRFLPVILPLLVVFAAVAVTIPRAFIANRRLGNLATGLCSLGLIFLIGSVGRPLWNIPSEFQGALAETYQFSQTFPTNSVVLSDQGTASTWLPLPLTYLFHRDTFAFQPVAIDDAQLDLALQSWWKQGKVVFFITDGGQATLNPDRWGFEHVSDQAFVFPQLKPDYWIPPTEIQTIQFNITAYQIVPLDQKVAPTFPFDLRMGTPDYGYLRSGFERADGIGPGSYRWTGEQAFVDLPRPRTDAWRITLRVGGNRPVGASPARLAIWVDDQPVKTIQFASIPSGNAFDSGYRDVVISGETGPHPPTGPIHLRLDVNTWRPADYGMGDGRNLGVVITDITVEESN